MRPSMALGASTRIISLSQSSSYWTVKMPVTDGWETLARLRRVSETLVIMLTVYSAKQDIIKGLELGADDYLVKPFGIKELIAHVTTVVWGRRDPSAETSE